MKRLYIILKVVLLIFIASCTKNKLAVDLPAIDISLDPSLLVNDTFTYRLGDTAKFIMNGTAENLAFYPGTNGFNYDNRHTTTLSSVKPIMSFSSTAQYGTQQNTLTILATDKLPSLDSTTVVNANWTDITARATLATSATSVNSGNIDLSDIVSGPLDSLFIAFKYHGETGATQRTWTITNYTIANILPNATFNISNLASDVSYWTKYGNVHTPANGMWIATTSQLQVVGGAAAPTNTAWIISRPLYVGNVNPNVSIAVKNINDPVVTSYNYLYTQPGTYKAVWVAFNNTIKDTKQVVKQFWIKVTQ